MNRITGKQVQMISYKKGLIMMDIRGLLCSYELHESSAHEEHLATRQKHALQPQMRFSLSCGKLSGSWNVYAT